jgi:hypothetical protein
MIIDFAMILIGCNQNKFTILNKEFFEWTFDEITSIYMREGAAVL